MTNFVELFKIMESWGMLDVLLPFLLIFTIVFAVLQKAKIFGADSKRFNVVIALVLGMVVVIPHILGTYPAGEDAVLIINNLLPNVALVLVAIIMVLLLSGVFGYTSPDSGTSGVILIPAFAIIIWLFGLSAGWWENFRWFNVDPDTIAVVLVLLVFGIIIWIVTSDNLLEGVKPIQGLFGKTK